MNKIVTYLIFFAIISSSLYTQILTDFNEHLNINNYGREFNISIPPSFQDENNIEPNYVKLYISSIKKTNVEINIESKAFQKNIVTTPGEITEIIIPPEIAQPYIKQVYLPAAENKIYKNSAISITADEPIFVYVIAENNVSDEGFTAYPVTALGTKYIVSSYGDGSYLYPLYHSFPSMIAVVGNFNQTLVSFTLGGNAVTTEPDGSAVGSKKTEVLNKGDVWLISTSGNFSDVSGSTINSSKPVSVISGNQSANIPIDNLWSDYIVEMMKPSESWGKTYHTFPVYGRKYNPVLRIFSNKAGAQISSDYIPFDTIAKPGGIIGDGYIEYRKDIEQGSYEIISSDKPIDIALYNTGTQEDNEINPVGGPFMLGLNSVEQYQNDALILIPGKNSFSDFNDNYLVIISKAPPEKIAIGNLSIGSADWNTIDELNILEQFSYLDGYNYYLIKIESYGLFRITSEENFASYIYGFNESTAYAYPGSSNLKTLNNDKLAPVPEWELNCNGDAVGKITDLPEENPSNLAYAIFDRSNSKNYFFEIDQIIPGVTNIANWNLKVQNRTEDAVAVIMFRDKANNDTTIRIEYKAPKISLTPKEFNFGSFIMDDEITDKNKKVFTITNNSDSDFTLSRLELLKGNEGFTIMEDFSEVIIKPKQNFDFTVAFNPLKEDLCIDSIGIGNECFFEYLGYVQAEVGVPVIEVTDIIIDDAIIDEPQYRKAYIKNIGKTDITISDIKGNYNNKFKIESIEELSQSNPYILRPNQEMEIIISFLADKEDNYIDSIIVISNADKIDNVCYINANVIPPGLVAQSYFWDKKRINRDNFPAGPYPVKNEHNGILLENISDYDLIISGFDVLESINADAFEFNKGILQNLKINAGESFVLPVNFRPENIGEHKLVFEYNDNIGGKARTSLIGKGVVPKIKVGKIDFDTCVVNSYNTYKTVNFNIKNMGFDEWQYADTLNIYSIIKLKNIADKWNEFEESEFIISDEFIEFPVKIEPGGSLVLRAGSVPLESGITNGKIKTSSDALEDKEIELETYGVYHNLTISEGFAETCINTPVKFSTTVTNQSTGTVNVKSVNIEDNSVFSFADANIRDGFPLNPNESKKIDLYFNPLIKSDYISQINLITESNPNLNRVAKITGKVNYEERNITVNPTSQTGMIGEKSLVNIILEDGPDISKYNITEFNLDINYNSAMVSIDKSDIEIGNALSGRFEIFDTNIDENTGKINLVIKGLNGHYLNNSGELVNLKFDVYLPYDSTINSPINVKLSSDADNCIDFKSLGGKINLEPICNQDLVKFKYSEYNFELLKINPNPVSENTNLRFSIGFDTPVKIELFNLTGEKINTICNDYLKAGNHEVEFNVEDISNGTYIIRINAGPFTKAERVVIMK